jgi:hypothetical protein
VVEAPRCPSGPASRRRPWGSGSAAGCRRRQDPTATQQLPPGHAAFGDPSPLRSKSPGTPELGSRTATSPEAAVLLQARHQTTAGWCHRPEGRSLHCPADAEVVPRARSTSEQRLEQLREILRPVYRGQLRPRHPLAPAAGGASPTGRRRAGSPARHPSLLRVAFGWRRSISSLTWKLRNLRRFRLHQMIQNSGMREDKPKGGGVGACTMDREERFGKLNATSRGTMSGRRTTMRNSR